MTDTLTKEALAEMRELLAKASAGPWFTQGQNGNDLARKMRIANYDANGRVHGIAGMCKFNGEADAAFLIALRNNAPALFTLAERAIEEETQLMKSAKSAAAKYETFSPAKRDAVQRIVETGSQPAAERPVEEIAREDADAILSNLEKWAAVFRRDPPPSGMFLAEDLENAAKLLRTERERTKAAEMDWNELHRLFVNLSRDHYEIAARAAALEKQIAELEAALKALWKQAVQSNVNHPANEWGQEAIAMAEAALSSGTPHLDKIVEEKNARITQLEEATRVAANYRVNGFDGREVEEDSLFEIRKVARRALSPSTQEG